ncbi:MAG: hypothetical protein A2W22_03815 [Candidatus Levybacteria bacterium RBG_16_35_11]|nr:MAG: hypothetical protein A2W22_03815 [Candidatus Levybacteria bacterium RBG_16_35_11]
MKIVFLTRRFWPEIGGVEKHTLEVGKRLVARGHELIVVTETPKNQASSNGNQSGVSSARQTGKILGIKIERIEAGIENWFKKFRVWKQLWGKKDIFKKADIVHCHDVLFWYLPFRLIYPHKPVYVTFHGYEGNKIPGDKAIFSHKLAEIFTKGNICIGNFYKKWYGTNATTVSYGAIEPEKNVSFKMPGKVKKILFAGRLEDETGIMEYLRALMLLPKRFKYSMDILGDGSLLNEAKNFCKENKINAKFHGFVKNVDKYTKNADYVFVSRYLGILETLVLKKPVFAVYNNKIKKDYLKMTPFKDFIFIEKNAEEIAHDLLKGISKEKIEDGYKWAIKQTWDKMVENYLSLWGISS